jgi:DNA-binding MarR family transcriptional regulator
MDYVRNTQITDRVARVLPLVHDRLQQMMSGVGATMGLSRVQVQLLEYVHRNGDSSIGTLRRALLRAQSSISELTDRLEEKGYVRRLTSDDRRKSLVALTAQGRKWMRNRDREQRNALGTYLSGLAPESQEELLSHLLSFLELTDRLRRSRGVPPMRTDRLPQPSAPSYLQ